MLTMFVLGSATHLWQGTPSATKSWTRAVQLVSRMLWLKHLKTETTRELVCIL